MGRAAGLDAPLLVPFVRILATTNNEQQESRLNTELTTAPERCRCRFAHEQDALVRVLVESQADSEQCLWSKNGHTPRAAADSWHKQWRYTRADLSLSYASLIRAVRRVA